MKKILLFCFAAVFLAACNKSEETKENIVPEQPQKEEQVHLPIAVVNVDSLLEKYTLAVEINEALTNKQENFNVEYAQKARRLDNEAKAFQKKYENNAFLSVERAESEQRRLINMEQNLQKFQQDFAQKIIEEQQKSGLRVMDSINNVVRLLNDSAQYHLVITTSAMNNNVLYSADEYDITQDVLDLLNKRYTKK